MKRIIYILLALSAALNARFAKAQNCPEKPTYTNQSGTFDLSSGRSIVLNSGATFQITVQNSFSSTSSICVTNGSKVNLSFLNVNTIQAGGSIYVEKNATLSITGNINRFPLTITNAGTVSQSASVTFTDGAVINNSGTYTMSAASTINDGTIAFTNSNIFDIKNALTTNGAKFTFTNTSAGTVTFNNTLTLNNTTLVNAGTINFNALQLQNSCTVRNNGYMYMTNTGSNSFFLSSTSTVTNSGVISVSGSIMINSDNTLNNLCTVRCFSSFTNNGTVTNNSLLLLTITSSACSFTNQGSFTNGTTALVQGYNFYNDGGSITGGGNFYFTNTTRNQATFAGTNGNIIDFYDVSNLTTKIFDVQNTNPSNTIKLVVTPNTVTSLLSCSDATPPAITAQPQTQILCNPSSATEATFSINATSTSTMTYQWRKNGAAIEGATSSSYTATNLTLADTANFYNVVVTNGIGSIWSNNVYVKYVIVASPSPLTQYLATGNAASFAIKTSGVKSWQWQKDGSNIIGATTPNYAISEVLNSDAANYTVFVRYDGGTCTSEAAVLRTSVILYSKAKGNLNLTSAWGVEADGSGSTPVDFTRKEHIFVVSNRASAETGGDLTIAGKLNIASSKVIITPNTTLDAGRITREPISRSAAPGVLAGSPTVNISVHGISNTIYAGTSDLYFDAANNTIKNLVTAAHTVTLHTALNITSGKDFGTLQVNSGTFITSDSLTLKSDSLGTAGIAKSAGTISGKVTIEKFIHARRAWRFMGAPVTDTDAPSINASWQEGATSSTANPAPGFGTHITGGTEAGGFDRSPNNNASLKYISASGAWTGLANTIKTPITQYPAYMLFVRGDRSYDILSTTAKTTPATTVLRVKGNVYQGSLAAKTVSAKGFTMVTNPYASPINFAKVLSASKNIKKRIYVWDPTLAGTKGVGAWVIVDGTTGAYKTTPPSTYVSTVLQAGQGFIIESADGTSDGAMTMNEDVKDFSAATTSGDRETGNTTDTSLEVNLKLFNEDNTASIADGILYNFGAHNNDSFDVSDAYKMYNTGENISVSEGSHKFAIDSRTAPKEGDSLKLNVIGVKAASYQLEFVPSLLKNKTFALYDKYLNTFSPISTTDTTRITFSVLSSVAASKAADRFTIVTQKSAVQPLPTVTQQFVFTKVKTYTKDNAINVEWSVQNESAVLYYQVQKSANGSSFSTAGNVSAAGKGTYSFADAIPAAGINYYRIKSVGKDGSIKYSPVVNGQLEGGTSFSAASAVSVYPNPLTGPSFTLTLTGMAAGTYTLSVVNANGAALFSRSITHSGGTASQKITLNNSLAAGIYYINITSATGTASSVKIAAN